MRQKIPYRFKKIKYYTKGLGTYLPESLNKFLPRHMHQFYGGNVKSKPYEVFRASYCSWMRMLKYLDNNQI